MGNVLVRLRLMVVASAFFGCFIASTLGASTIAERTYLIAVYGLDAVQREHLHIERSKPRLRISNGDQASEIRTFAAFVLALPLWLTFMFLGIRLTRILTKLLGREVSIIADLPNVQRNALPGPKSRADLRELITAAAVFAITFAATSKLFGRDDLGAWLRYYAGMIIAFSVLLRLVFIGTTAPVVDENLHDAASRKRRYVWPL